MSSVPNVALRVFSTSLFIKTGSFIGPQLAVTVKANVPVVPFAIVASAAVWNLLYLTFFPKKFFTILSTSIFVNLSSFEQLEKAPANTIFV